MAIVYRLYLLSIINILDANPVVFTNNGYERKATRGKIVRKMIKKVTKGRTIKKVMRMRVTKGKDNEKDNKKADNKKKQ
jgi:hypothetical protein